MLTTTDAHVSINKAEAAAKGTRRQAAARWAYAGCYFVRPEDMGEFCARAEELGVAENSK